MHSNLYKSLNKIKILFYFIFYLFLRTILLFIKPYQNKIAYFKKKLKIRHSLFKIYFKEEEDVNKLIAFIFTRQLSYLLKQ